MSASDGQSRADCFVQACLRAEQITPWPMRFNLTLGYEPTDPLVVRLVIHGSKIEPWIIGRDLFVEGLTDHAGFGDVRMWPCSRAYVDVLCVALRGDGGSALFELSAADVRRFLDRTFRQVPRGAEADHLDLDQLVSRLLAETP